jgi:hypothetical protein
VEKPQKPAVSPRSGVAPPKETQFGGPRANPGCPAGRPKGFVPLSQAYAILGAKFEPSEIEQIARGEKPAAWGKRPLLMPYVAAARMWLLGTPPAASEIADRTEGKVKNTTDLNLSVQDVAGFFSMLVAEEPE